MSDEFDAPSVEVEANPPDTGFDAEPDTELVPETVADDRQAEVSDVESRAKKYGWAPKDQWRGDPSRWRDADEFLRVQEEHLPVAKENLRRLEDRLEAMQRRLEEQYEIGQKALRAQKERHLRELDARRRAAVEVGDAETFNAVEREMQETANEFLDAQPQPPRQGQPNRDVQDWLARNTWYDRDMDARLYADALTSQKLSMSPDKIVTPAMLRDIEAKVRTVFPQHFQSQRQPRQITSDPGRAGVSAPPKQSKRTFEHLPPEAKRICLELEADGMSRADYLKFYPWDER